MECSICFEHIQSNLQTCNLICGHTFHSVCLCIWNIESNKCPICRTESICGCNETKPVDSLENIMKHDQKTIEAVMKYLIESKKALQKSAEISTTEQELRHGEILETVIGINNNFNNIGDWIQYVDWEDVY